MTNVTMCHEHYKTPQICGVFTYSEDKPTSSGSVGLAIALFRILRPATLTYYVRNSIISQNSAKCAIFWPDGDVLVSTLGS